ncbi:hypothetical protein CCR75_000416 [Bremia lactucae]|uniref:Sugar phosphate transporter domain-containing protein n=1 Tax=Bremia lactucae TaxID=4779 RepID=A0A976ICW5_BRELC|nr:hypothetical protein CCR75_000416 [Bremia lactucae]
MVAKRSTALKVLVQFVFLVTGVVSTCVAQYVFYQGAGDQKAMLLPLCNYLGMMLVGLLPTAADGQKAVNATRLKKSKIKSLTCEADQKLEISMSPEVDVEQPELTPTQTDRCLSPKFLNSDLEALTRRPVVSEDHYHAEEALSSEDETKPPLGLLVTPSLVSLSLSTEQLCIVVSVVLDFAGCIFSNIGLAMAGSGLYQVVYSSVICWSALMSRFLLKKVVSKEEWFGIALVTFGLAFSALGESRNERHNTIVLMGCLNTLVGAAFYGANYVTGEFTLKLAVRPHPKELCLKIGSACVTIIAIYQSLFVLPEWNALVTQPIMEAKGNTTHIVAALVAYTLSQLAHGLTYFVMLGTSGAVTTGIIQSLRAVCVFGISSMLYCSQQESQCFDTKRGVAALIVVSGVMYYSWAKNQQGRTNAPAPSASSRPSQITANTKIVAGKNYVN